MNLAAVDKIAKALLYEGYMLYPYRPSAVKNQQRFNFGVLYPRSYVALQGHSEPCSSRTECIAMGSSATVLEVRIRFLRLAQRSVYQCLAGGGERIPVARIEAGGQIHQPWQEAVEHEVCLPPTSLGLLGQRPLRAATTFPASETEQPVRDNDGGQVGLLVVQQKPLSINVEVAAEPVDDFSFKLAVQVNNETPTKSSLTEREDALLQSAVSTHTILGVENGEFASLLDPPESLLPLTESCRNVGVFPVLIGPKDQRGTMLASPIILYDYPEIAAESAGDLFDATEIDEILSLRIMALTEDEKREIRNSDDRARRILERTDALPEEQLLKLHGVLRGMRRADAEPLQ